ncbi:MAG: ABC transporter permease [Verrucomicrobiota bacterium]
MTFWKLIRRNLSFHARAHLGVVLGAAIGSAALIGALVVGDSVRTSLTNMALRRLGQIHFALSSQDRLFEASLGTRLQKTFPGGNIPGDSKPPAGAQSPSCPLQSSVLLLPGVVAKQDGSARANSVTVLGVDKMTWPILANWGPSQQSGAAKVLANRTKRELEVSAAWEAGEAAYINEALARQLGAREGDDIVLRVRKPTALGLDAAISPRSEQTVAFRLKIAAIVPSDRLGDFSLRAQPSPPANLFLRQDCLATKLDIANRANLLVEGALGTPSRPTPDQLALGGLNIRLSLAWALGDAELSVGTVEQPVSATGGEGIASLVEVTSSRIFLDSPVVAAARKPGLQQYASRYASTGHHPSDFDFRHLVTNGVRVLTYLANQLRAADHATPYSMVTAANAPYVPSDMRDDEILVNQWLADDLQVKPGDAVALSYYVVDSGSGLLERTNSFRVRGIVPLTGIYADRTLMPQFPGLAKAETTHDWDAGFPLVYPIRAKDEAYWKTYRGTPKAFVTLAAGQAMWANRFGSLTAVRYAVPTNTFASTIREAVYRNLLHNLKPEDVGLRFEAVREQALWSAAQSQDFGQLFLGFSLFLVVAALLLMALLFQLGLEQRTSEVGILLALGFTPKQVRRLLLVEGIALALAGGLIGAVGGIVYAKVMLWALTTVWRNAIGGAELQFHLTTASLFIGICASTVVATLTIWLTLRKQARQPARELLAGEVSSQRAVVRGHAAWIALGSGLTAIAIVGWALASGHNADAEAFFSAGALLLVAGLASSSAWLTRLAQEARRVRAPGVPIPSSFIIHPSSFPLVGRVPSPGAAHLTLRGLGVRGCARRRKRSLATIALLACGTFVIVAIGVFRLDANRDATQRDSGTGGFALIGEATMPVVQDLNTKAGREFYGLSAEQLAGVNVVPLRLRDGDMASCLNLNRAQKPRLLGVKPELLADRFTFASVAKGLDRHMGWRLLQSGSSRREEALTGQSPIEQSLLTSAATGTNEIPAIGDSNSIQWAMGKAIGDTIDYTDEQGRAFKLRLVGAVANSILQGSLLIDEAEFTKRFPSESGYRMLLIDAPSNSVAQVSATLSRALQDAGLELTPTAQRLNQFNAVQNTYLGTFQILGGLGLLLGSAGLGVVVLRNVLERRGELGLLVAVGFRRRLLHRLVLSEHGVLLGAGLGLGIAAAAVAVLPAILSPGSQLPYGSLVLTLLAILLNGLLWTWLATNYALRGNLLAALRNE